MPTIRHLPLRRDLGIQLLALFTVFVGSVLIAAFFFAQSATHQLETDVGAADLALANAITQETDTALNSALEAVRMLSQFSAVRASDPDEMADLFQHAMSARGDVNLTYRLGPDGIMVFHYPVGPESTVGQEFSFRPYFQRALLSRAPLLSAGRISPTTNEPVATAVMPLWEGDTFLGVVATNIKLQFLSDTLTNITRTTSIDADMHIAIIDSAGQIVAHSDPQWLLLPAAELMPRPVELLMNGESGNVIARDSAGEEVLYSFVHIKRINWSVVVSRPTATAFTAPVSFRRGALAISTIFLGSGLLFWLILSRRVILPLERLAAFSQRVWVQPADPGDMTQGLTELTVRSDQMGVLTRSLKKMQDAIEARLNELSTLLKTSGAVVSTLDSQTVLGRILEQVEQLLNVGMSAIFVLDEDAKLCRVRASRNLPAWYAEQVKIDPLDPNSATMRAIRSGEPIQISDVATDPTYAHNRARAQLAGYNALLAVPLPVQHVQPAALLVYHAEPYIFSEREIRLLTSFANHATMAIENAALYARSDTHLKEQTRRIEALIESMHDGLVLEDFDGNIVYANHRVQELLALSVQPLHKQPSRVLVDAIVRHAQDAERVRENIATALATDGIRHVECAQVDGASTYYLRLTLFNVTDTQDKRIGRGWIVEDITQRYELDRMRASLISTVSHELRTPLAAIKGYATTLLADDVQWDTQSQHEFLSTISSETDRLSNLVRDLLDMSRIEAGSFTLTRTSTDLRELVYQAAEHANPRPGDRLMLDIPPDLPLVHVDPQRLEAVVRNLIENSAKYCPEDTPIQVRLKHDRDRLNVFVADQGPGIPNEHAQRIFDSFYRVENGMTRNTAGAGLGLTIARGFVQAHGGQIWLEPCTTGLCVAFSIPLNMDKDGLTTTT